MNQSQTPQFVSRLAPTPSGFLHIGNAYNFLLTWWITRSLDGKLWLRIDDADTGRRRPEFLQDIFESIEWLGIDYDFGPKDVDDFLRNFSQTIKKENYLASLGNARDLFACDCSRKLIKERSSNGTYPGICHNKQMNFERGSCALRVKVSKDFTPLLGEHTVKLAERMGDFVVWRKDDIPAYQLTSVVDDVQAGVNLIVRGQDLLESSAAQIYLAEKLGFKEFENINIIHHQLVLDEKGEKISKSQSTTLGEEHLKFRRDKKMASLDLIRDFARDHGLDPQEINGPQDLLSHRPPYLISE